MLNFHRLLVSVLAVGWLQGWPALGNSVREAGDSAQKNHPAQAPRQPLDPKAPVETQSIPDSGAQADLFSSAWAIQSLSHFMELDGCAARSSDALWMRSGNANRYEMASLLATCLDQWGNRDLEGQEQKTLQALRSEFKSELAALQGSSVWIPMGSMPAGLNPASASPTVLQPQSPAVMEISPVYGGAGQFANPLLTVEAAAIFGRGKLLGHNSLTVGRSPIRSEAAFGERDIQSWTAGIGIRDFIIPRSLLAVSASQSNLTTAPQQISQINYSAFYQFPISKRLTLSPSLVIMTNSDSPSNPAIQGALQASFSF